MVTNNSCNIPTGATGTILRGAGIGTAPAFSAATYPATAGSNGNVLTSDGTNWNSTAPLSAGLLPAFRIALAATKSNVTGDGTLYTVPFDTVVYDQASNVSGATFVAPTKGIYLFTASVALTNLSTTSGINSLIYVNGVKNTSCYWNNTVQAANACSVVVTNYIKLNATDIVDIRAIANNGTKSVNVNGAVSDTYFSGALMQYTP